MVNESDVEECFSKKQYRVTLMAIWRAMVIVLLGPAARSLN